VNPQFIVRLGARPQRRCTLIAGHRPSFARWLSSPLSMAATIWTRCLQFSGCFS